MSRIGDDGRVLAFDYGVSSVRWGRDAPRLPDEGQAPAVDTRPILHLEALFEGRGTDEMFDAAALPELSDRAVLDPARFAAALDVARDALLQLGAAAGPGPRRAVLAAALTTLENADQDRAVLDTARRALLRG